MNETTISRFARSNMDTSGARSRDSRRDRRRGKSATPGKGNRSEMARSDMEKVRPSSTSIKKGKFK